MDGVIGCADLWPFVQVEMVGHKLEHALLALAVAVPLWERAVVPMRSTRGGENDVTLMEDEYMAEDALGMETGNKARQCQVLGNLMPSPLARMLRRKSHGVSGLSPPCWKRSIFVQCSNGPVEPSMPHNGQCSNSGTQSWALIVWWDYCKPC